MAHEINNPVGCILGNVCATQDYVNELLGIIDLYSKQLPEPGPDIEVELEAVDLEFMREDLPQLIRAMKDSRDRIRSISKSLRTFSRADTDNKQSFDIRTEIDSTVLILRHRFKANEQRPAIQVIKDYDNIPNLTCFPVQLNQVFMNILANAIDMFDEVAQQTTFEELKDTPSIITIQAKSSIKKKAIEVRISDNGKGMSDSVKSKIFDHLFTTKMVGKGTGLGLVIAKQIIVEKHDGKIEVQTQLGSGTEFIITLPVG